MAVLLDAAFGHPRGLLGRLGGLIMRRVNADEERRAVALAAVKPGETVLAVGPGPGVGLAEAWLAVGPDGRAIGVDPSPTMRAMAAQHCPGAVVRAGSAERTGCAESEVDAAVSVNNVLFWDIGAALTELHRVVKPGGRLVIAMHRHVIKGSTLPLVEAMKTAGFDVRSIAERKRFANSGAVEIIAVKGPRADA